MDNINEKAVRYIPIRQYPLKGHKTSAEDLANDMTIKEDEVVKTSDYDTWRKETGWRAWVGHRAEEKALAKLQVWFHQQTNCGPRDPDRTLHEGWLIRDDGVTRTARLVCKQRLTTKFPGVHRLVSLDDYKKMVLGELPHQFDAEIPEEKFEEFYNNGVDTFDMADWARETYPEELLKAEMTREEINGAPDAQFIRPKKEAPKVIKTNYIPVAFGVKEDADIDPDMIANHPGIRKEYRNDGVSDEGQALVNLQEKFEQFMGGSAPEQQTLIQGWIITDTDGKRTARLVCQHKQSCFVLFQSLLSDEDQTLWAESHIRFRIENGDESYQKYFRDDCFEISRAVEDFLNPKNAEAEQLQPERVELAAAA